MWPILNYTKFTLLQKQFYIWLDIFYTTIFTKLATYDPWKNESKHAKHLVTTVWCAKHRSHKFPLRHSMHFDDCLPNMKSLSVPTTNIWQEAQLSPRESAPQADMWSVCIIRTTVGQHLNWYGALHRSLGDSTASCVFIITNNKTGLVVIIIVRMAKVSVASIPLVSCRLSKMPTNCLVDPTWSHSLHSIPHDYILKNTMMPTTKYQLHTSQSL